MRPSIAEAATVAGEARKICAFAPIRSSKLRVLHEIAISPGARIPPDDPGLRRLMLRYRRREQERNRTTLKQRQEAAAEEQATREATRFVIERFGPLFWQNSADGELIGKKAERVRNEPQ